MIWDDRIFSRNGHRWSCCFPYSFWLIIGKGNLFVIVCSLLCIVPPSCFCVLFLYNSLEPQVLYSFFRVPSISYMFTIISVDWQWAVLAPADSLTHSKQPRSHILKMQTTDVNLKNSMRTTEKNKNTAKPSMPTSQNSSNSHHIYIKLNRPQSNPQYIKITNAPCP